MSELLPRGIVGSVPLSLAEPGGRVRRGVAVLWHSRDTCVCAVYLCLRACAWVVGLVAPCTAPRLYGCLSQMGAEARIRLHWLTRCRDTVTPPSRRGALALKTRGAMFFASAERGCSVTAKANLRGSREYSVSNLQARLPEYLGK